MISDLQIPFEADRALAFAVSVKKHYKIPDENCLNVGDETDCLFGGMYKKDPNGEHSAHSELAQSRETLKRWYSAFPKMKLAISNHGLRWVRKATDAEIPSQLLRSYEEIVQAPDTWIWKPEWKFTTLKHPFRMIHGMGYSGMNGHRTAALDAGMSTVLGHLHSHAGVSHIKTENQRIWGMNVGCLIDVESYAFSYGKDSRFKPCLGLGVIFGEGSTPAWIPYE